MNYLSLFGRGAGLFTLRRLIITGAAAAGLYGFGDEGLSYLKTANRLVGENVVDQIPVEFELERARTMIGELKPDIKRNVVLIAQEEVQVDNIREDIDDTRDSLASQRSALKELREALGRGGDEIRIADRPATTEEVENELKRRFSNYRLTEATLESKLQLLTHRESSLAAAREKLKRMLEARRDLEVQIENLEARMRTVQSEAVASQVDFDESHVARCEELIDSLRSRLQVAERLMSQDVSSEIPQATTFNVGEVSVVDEIDQYFAESSPSDSSLSSLN